MKRSLYYPSGPSEPPLRIPLDPTPLNGVIVFIPGKTPPVDELRRTILDWIARHASKPLAARLEDQVESGRLVLEPIVKPDVERIGLCRILTGGRDTPERVRGSALCVRIIAYDSLSTARAGLWSVVAAGRAIGAAWEGAVLDALAGVFWKPCTFERCLPADGSIAAGDHIFVLSSVDERGLGWITIAGMKKFGLPDFEIRDAPPNLYRELGYLMNGLAQLFLEAVEAAGRQPGHPEAELRVDPELEVTAADVTRALRNEQNGDGKRAVRVRLRYDTRGGGERDPLITLLPPRGFSDGHGVWLHEAVGRLRGRPEPAEVVVHRAPDDAALQAAHRKAVARIDEVKARFQRGLAPGESLLVKRGFSTDEGMVEFMWVAINTWKGRRLQGQLTSDPRYLTELRPGAPVEIDQSEIYDWMIEGRDGALDGGYTDRVLGGR